MSDVHASVEQGNITRNPGGRMEKVQLASFEYLFRPSSYPALWFRRLLDTLVLSLTADQFALVVVIFLPRSGQAYAPVEFRCTECCIE